MDKRKAKPGDKRQDGEPTVPMDDVLRRMLSTPPTPHGSKPKLAGKSGVVRRSRKS